MANTTRDLRRRIRSVRNTAQLTRAMKMVAAAKLRRAQEAMLAARPYSHALRRVLGGVARRARPELNPLLTVRPPRRIELFVLTGDKGLCGGFNGAILREAERWRTMQTAAGNEVTLCLIGKKAVEHYRRRPQVAVRLRLTDFGKDGSFGAAQSLAADIERRFVADETDAVHLAYNEFKSVISARVVVEPLLPLAALAGDGLAEAPPLAGVDFIYEPEAERLLAALLSRFLAFALHHALLESAAAEHGARMAAMDNATRNAEEMIGKLTLTMNRLRQASITKEIIEVVSGAEALG